MVKPVKIGWVHMQKTQLISGINPETVEKENFWAA
ncbi:hypothetical protein P872_21060 [Rhodonellum psychrophilum GCM71 = DSM 17998]|uniref:Uncharacterized protein n=1 Tax=Rhodonellum psychrophilum GCM71 = DSM 17998 TaxID=1123057 RepID=U5BTC7_9BACT|nr:hypothetical protein P872_21060 [Rhodonellum psychrophilum GCM71 = DSM 17998]